MVSLLAIHGAQQHPLAYIFMAMKLWLMSWWIQVTCWIGIDDEIHDDDHDILIILLMVIIMIIIITSFSWAPGSPFPPRILIKSGVLVLNSALVQTILVWFGSNHLAGFGVPDFRFESHYQGPLSSGSKLYRSFNILTTPSSLYRSEWDWDCLGFFFFIFLVLSGFNPTKYSEHKMPIIVWFSFVHECDLVVSSFSLSITCQ